jgi:hypothetical protein
MSDGLLICSQFVSKGPNRTAAGHVKFVLKFDMANQAFFQLRPGPELIFHGVPTCSDVLEIQTKDRTIRSCLHLK